MARALALMRIAADLLMGTSFVLIGISLVRGGPGLEGRVPSAIWATSLVLWVGNSLLTRRQLHRAEIRGKWAERATFLNSVEEAQLRGMSPQEFVEAYGERISMEAHADFGTPVQAPARDDRD